MTQQNTGQLPVLYSFRRCPYAMRARLVLEASDFTYEHREILLRDKPEEMIAASPKATVPVLVMADGTVLEQSRDIMEWTLIRSDPRNWRPKTGSQLGQMNALIDQNDGPFKDHLDRYKYGNRYEDVDPLAHRDAAAQHLHGLNDRLKDGYLLGAVQSQADIAIFPFVRQFANHDRAWFDAQPWPDLLSWLAEHLAMPAFQATMVKRPPWAAGDEPLVMDGTRHQLADSDATA